MRSALVAHDKVLRTAIEAYDGFLFSHTRAAAMAAFASPMSAVNAAIDAHRELQLPLRMRIAPGEAELARRRHFRTVLNRASRVMAAGHGGQILVADFDGRFARRRRSRRSGTATKSDLPTPVEVVQVRAPRLRTDTIGRESEIA
jgi:class 3 adenylate cyclase